MNKKQLVMKIIDMLPDEIKVAILLSILDQMDSESFLVVTVSDFIKEVAG